MTWTDEELAHERAMREDGEARYRRLVERAKTRGELSLLPSGRALIRDTIAPVARAIEAWLERAEDGPGPAHDLAPLLGQVHSEVLAMLAVTVVVDGLHRPRPLTTVAAAVGRAVEDEVRFGAFRRAEPNLWNEVMRGTRRSTPTHRRAVIVARAGAAEALPAGWGTRNRVRAGAALMDVVRAETGLFELVRTSIGGPKRRIDVVPTTAALEWLARADERAAVLTPLYMPTIVIPAEWDGVEGGGYHTDVVLRRPIARFRGARHRALVEERGPGDLVLAAMNHLQGVPWEVNEDVLEVIDGCPELVPSVVEEPIPPKPVDIQTNTEARLLWRRAARAARDRNVARRSRAISLRRTVAVARRLNGRRFYYPQRLDFRGRVYPIPHWLSPQGEDYSRALVRFASGCPVMPETVGVLERFAGGLHGEGFDPGVVDAIYRDPLQDTGLWAGADEPFQFLGAALELGAARAGDIAEHKVPIHLDATNNGLQLYALMTGDRDLALATNAIEGPARRDLYTEVAAAATARLHADAMAGVEDAHRWLACLPVGAIPRDLAKRPVMTLPYGVTEFSAQRYVRDWYDETFGRDGPLGTAPGKLCGYLARVIMGEVEGRCAGAALAMRWLREAALAVVEEGGVPVRWTSPSGWPIQQEYRKGGRLRVRATIGGAVRHLRLRTPGADLDAVRQARGFPPNFVHSIDAAILHRFAANWDGPLVTIHDSYGVLPLDVGFAGLGLRLAVTAITIERDPLSELREELMGYSRIEIPPPPRLGTIDAGEVARSVHLYS